jgi:hypothetical protein
VDEPFLYMEGDVVTTPAYLTTILRARCPTVGLMCTQTEDPVFVVSEPHSRPGYAIRFSDIWQEYEWPGIAKLRLEHLADTGSSNPEYPVLREGAPAKPVIIDCAKVRTLDDLDAARIWVKQNLLLMGHSGVS